MHKLADGQRFFRDGTPADAITITKNRIIHHQKAGQPIPPATAEQLMTDARNNTGEWRMRWPMTDRFDADRQDHREKYWKVKS